MIWHAELAHGNGIWHVEPAPCNAPPIHNCYGCDFVHMLRTCVRDCVCWILISQELLKGEEEGGRGRIVGVGMCKWLDFFLVAVRILLEW